jgi:type I restriction enzyme S subunit
MTYKVTALSELALITDSLHKTPHYSAVGRPMVRVTDIKYGYLKLENTLRVADDVYAEFTRRYKPAINDIVVSRVGSYGNFAKVIDTDFCLGQNTAAIIPNKINPNYLFYALTSKTVKEQIEASVVGSTQKTLSLKNIALLKIPRFTENIEGAIGLHGYRLDRKIELLKETNTTLEAIAQTIFKSWFVDFDPVHAKQQGVECAGIDKATADLFPSSFVQSELGLIPEGWAVGSFTNDVRVISGGTPKTSINEYWHGDIPWYSVVDAPDKNIFVIDTEKHITKLGLEKSAANLLEAGVTIISARGTVGKLAIVGTPMAMNQSCYGLHDVNDCHFYTFLNTKRIVNELKQNVHGSVFDTITRETLSNVAVVSPSSALKTIFEKKVSPILLKVRANNMQLHSIATLRDTLLPRLMSGKLDLTEIEEQLEGVV